MSQLELLSYEYCEDVFLTYAQEPLACFLWAQKQLEHMPNRQVRHHYYFLIFLSIILSYNRCRYEQHGRNLCGLLQIERILQTGDVQRLVDMYEVGKDVMANIVFFNHPRQQIYTEETLEIWSSFSTRYCIETWSFFRTEMLPCLVRANQGTLLY